MAIIKNAGERAADLYRSYFGAIPTVTPMPGAGSDRRYFRISSDEGPCVVATVGDNVSENRCFVELSRSLGDAGMPTPHIHAVSPDGSVYLQEDFGSKDLLSMLGGPCRRELSRKALGLLARVQNLPSPVWENHVSAKPFSARSIKWDLNYFKYEFLKTAGIGFDEEKLEDDFDGFAEELCGASVGLSGFMYRDFQSRNIMVDGERLGLIDFQGGRRGPGIYDAVSFLWQAKARFTSEERAELIAYYAGEYARLRGCHPEDVTTSLDDFVLLRTLQVLGAYGLRGLIEKRAHFVESIPGALANLRELVSRGAVVKYPELERVCKLACESRFAEVAESDGLKVKVFSFSYKKGYPEDLSGNGGGFMFDCRGLPNPGRFDCYKRQTGLDEDVRVFLQGKRETEAFIGNALDMVRGSVAVYSARGFTSLQVGFGCTGGRHRSVYCAKAFAERLSQEFPDVVFELQHREQGISETFNVSTAE